MVLGMRIKVEFSIDVDPEAWADEYGVEGDAVRRDVQSYAQHVVTQQFDSVGVLAR